MPTDENDVQMLKWKTGAPDAGELFLHQVVGLIRQAVQLDIQIAQDRMSFQSRKAGPRRGIGSVRAQFLDDAVMAIQFELLNAPGQARVLPQQFFSKLSQLGEKTRFIPPVQDPGPGRISLWVELRVQASPMSMARSSVFLSELKNLEALAEALQDELPEVQTDSDLIERYKTVSDVLEPVLPWEETDPDAAGQSEAWSRETGDFLHGSLSVAMAVGCQAEESYFLARLASFCRPSGESIGRVILPVLNTKALVEIVNKAPGIVAVSAPTLSFGTNIYEMVNEIQTLLQVLSSSRKSVIFTGTYPQLQSVFHGGQGGSSDPMMPVVRHAPAMQLDPLIRFVIARNGQKSGGLSKSQEQDLFGRVQGSLASLPREKRMRVLPALVNREIHQVLSQGIAPGQAAEQYAVRIGSLAETLSGLSDKPRVERFPHVQSHFTGVLTDPGLEDYLRGHLLAQDEAIGRLVSRLRMECLTRPPHQPLRYCSQGTPATGKSESAILLARRLGIPYINIDAASIPDFYTASAQLLGSGRGIVGSYQSGRLEQAAKHHSGALVEVSDLDHAPAQVRSALADLFLQVLETGEAQSAAGAMFSCANIVFAFTINLPNGLDESVRKRFGFQEGPSDRDIRRTVSSEIKSLFSSAFLSRIGTPILFKPLDGDALSVIVERAVLASVLSAASRLDWEMTDVLIENGVGHAVVANIESSILSFGARGLLEEARTLAAEALMGLQKSGGMKQGRCWSIGVETPFRLVIREKQKRR